MPTKEIIGECQCGFRVGRSTVDNSTVQNSTTYGKIFRIQQRIAEYFRGFSTGVHDSVSIVKL